MINFEDLPSRKTPIYSPNLNKLQKDLKNETVIFKELGVQEDTILDNISSVLGAEISNGQSYCVKIQPKTGNSVFQGGQFSVLGFEVGSGGNRYGIQIAYSYVSVAPIRTRRLYGGKWGNWREIVVEPEIIKQGEFTVTKFDDGRMEIKGYFSRELNFATSVGSLFSATLTNTTSLFPIAFAEEPRVTVMVGGGYPALVYQVIPNKDKIESIQFLRPIKGNAKINVYYTAKGKWK